MDIQTSPRFELLTLRMLGQNVTFCRHQWLELLDELADSDDKWSLKSRIQEMLSR